MAFRKQIGGAGVRKIGRNVDEVRLENLANVTHEMLRRTKGRLVIRSTKTDDGTTTAVVANKDLLDRVGIPAEFGMAIVNRLEAQGRIKTVRVWKGKRYYAAT